MDTKLTLSFDETIAQKAKDFAAAKGMSLSRMVEHIFAHLTSNPKYYDVLDDIPFADYVNMVAEDMPVYGTVNQKKRKEEYYRSKK